MIRSVFRLPLLSSSIIFLAAAPIPAAQAQDSPEAEHLLDTVVITASPLARTLFDQAQPVSVLSQPELKLRLQPTLGETLSGTPGVSSTYFGPAASRPIIRGLDADRIRVLQNGSNTIDASGTSVDHAVSFDPISLRSIEVVRGPAALLYGANAVGGVVNVIDGRIPDTRLGLPITGTLDGRYGSVNSERGGALMLEGEVGRINWHLEGYKRATDELHIPGFARSDRLRRLEPLPDGEKEARHVLPNSDLRTEGLSGGASYIWDGGFFGLAYSGFHTNYGTVAEREVTIDLEQRRWDFRGAFFKPFVGVKAVKYSLGVSDYEHTEFEGALTGTIFENEGFDGRIEVTHEKLGPFEGVVGFQSEKSAFSALGEEAFLPAVETVANSVFVFEEVALDPVRLQFGARYDHSRVESSRAANFGPGRERDFDNVSGSAGLVWTPSEPYAVALSLAYTRRAPTYQELFANGPHLATNAFEIGDAELDVEQSFSIDLTFRKKSGFVTGAVSFFVNHFEDFVGQFATGEEVVGEEDALPVFAYRNTDATFFGGEIELLLHLLEPVQPPASKDAKATLAAAFGPALHLELKADYVHASDTRASDPLPRIPPFRGGSALVWQHDRLGARVEGQYVARQNRTAEFELPTDSYFLVNASVSYRIPMGRFESEIYVKGVNLTDEEARLHTSFLKDIAPLAGRGVLVGWRTTF